jgi:Icc protein
MQAAHDIHLIQISDTHLNADPQALLWGFDNNAILLQLLEFASHSESHIDGLLATGDLVDDGSAAGYRRLAALADQLRLPLYWLPGNHDSPEVMARELAGAYLRSPGLHDLGSWTLITLDTHLPGQDAGLVTDEDMDTLEKSLNLADKPVLLALHHHPVAVQSVWLDDLMLENGEALLQLLARYQQAKVVLFGHVHQEFEAHYQGVHLLACPSGTRQFLPQSSTFALDVRLPGYRWINLKSNGQINTGIRRLKNLF